MKILFFMVLCATVALGACAPVHPVVETDQVIARAEKDGAEAVVLRRSAWLVAENAAWGPFTVEVFNRTKVLTSAGTRYAKMAIAMPERPELLHFEGRTIHPDGSEVEASGESVRIDKGKLLFELPGPKAGSVLEYRYRVRSHVSMALYRWSFQSSIPTVRTSLTVNWPKWAKLGYQLVNQPAGQSAEPDVRSGHGPGIPEYARITWRFVDLEPTPPGKDRSAIVVGLEDLLFEKRLAQREGWGTGFLPWGFGPPQGPKARSPYGQPGSSLPPSSSPSRSGAPIKK